MTEAQEHEQTAEALSSAAEYCWEAVEGITGALRELRRVARADDLAQGLDELRKRCEEYAKRCEAEAERHQGCRGGTP
jgi:hypothetical protein